MSRVMVSDRLVTVFGGSGFVGRHVVRALAARGWQVRNACRRPDLAGHLQPLGSVGQIVSVQANLRHEGSVRAACVGAADAASAVSGTPAKLSIFFFGSVAVMSCPQSRQQV